MGSSEGRSSSSSYEFGSGQSIPSMLVDLACIGAVVFLAIKNVREPAVWSILSGLMIGRFGVSHSKTMERSNRSGGGGDSGSWGPGSRREVIPVPPTEERDPRTFPRPPTPRPIPREDPPRRSVLPNARRRLADWIARRRAAAGMPWWTRRTISIPLTSIRVDAVSLAAMLVLVAVLTRVVAAAQR